MAALIEVENVTKRFRIPSAKRETIREHFFGLFTRRTFDDLCVLDSISFHVDQGETVGIMGRNGCGKSTLLKILAGIYRPDAGRVTVRAPITPILELGVGWKGELTARDNIFLTGTAMGLSLAELDAGVGEILRFAELERFENLELKFYSSGMSSRLAYAIAFQAVREILVLDEIFAVGDASFRARCEARYQELAAAGHTVVLVGHDTKTVERFCTRALLLDGAKIALEGTGAEIAKAYDRVVGGKAA
jgi:ABC-2 type transport system ATP-binding protein